MFPDGVEDHPSNLDILIEAEVPRDDEEAKTAPAINAALIHEIARLVFTLELRSYSIIIADK